ncbi:MAG: 4-hydroxy-tetrahydrodipicolinate reductase [Planctomycetota bacterium]|nr:MAG: 4-hydroxy-tetrahydrodipicolinate reductase [Planctomycetota bacterium]
MRLIVHGASGRMGRRVVALAAAQPGWQVVAALGRPGSQLLGRDAGELAGVGPLGVPLQPRWPEQLQADAAIDFSTPPAAARFVQQCAARAVPVVVGTTGLQPAERAVLERAAERVAVLLAANLSTGVALLQRLVREAAAALGLQAEIEIVEVHHRHKRDAPSGTALVLARAAAAARGQDVEAVLRRGRPAEQGAASRSPGEIGLHAVRLGEVVGEHTVMFAFGAERLELTHRAHDRDVFAQGALRAAAFVRSAPPGLYGPEAALGAGAGGTP